jgi:hypothetical protein
MGPGYIHSWRNYFSINENKRRRIIMNKVFSKSMFKGGGAAPIRHFSLKYGYNTVAPYNIILKSEE